MVRTHMHVIPSYGDFLNMLPFNSAIQDARARCVAMVTKRPASRRMAMKAMKVMKAATKSASTKLGGDADFLVVFECF